jgi:hypothetical protein
MFHISEFIGWSNWWKVQSWIFVVLTTPIVFIVLPLVLGGTKLCLHFEGAIVAGVIYGIVVEKWRLSHNYPIPSTPLEEEV